MPSAVSKPFLFWDTVTVKNKTQGQEDLDSMYDSACLSKAQFLLTCPQALALMTETCRQLQVCRVPWPWQPTQGSCTRSSCLASQRTLKCQLKFCMLPENFPAVLSSQVWEGAAEPSIQHPAPFTLEMRGHFQPLPPFQTSKAGRTHRCSP